MSHPRTQLNPATTGALARSRALLTYRSDELGPVGSGRRASPRECKSVTIMLSQRRAGGSVYGAGPS